MGATTDFVACFSPIFSLDALFGGPLDDSGAVQAIADGMTRRLGQRRAVLAGALVTYGGVGVFVASFVLAPTRHGWRSRAGVP